LYAKHDKLKNLPTPIINVNLSGPSVATHNLEVVLREFKKLPTDKKDIFLYYPFFKAENSIQLSKQGHWNQAISTLIKYQNERKALKAYKFPDESLQALKLILRPVSSAVQVTSKKRKGKNPAQGGNAKARKEGKFLEGFMAKDADALNAEDGELEGEDVVLQHIIFLQYI
jgi:hypothetical protein